VSAGPFNIPPEPEKFGHNGGPPLEPLPAKLVPLSEFYGPGRCSRAAAFLWIKQGRLKAYRFGARTFVTESFVEFVVRQDAEQRQVKAERMESATRAARKRWSDRQSPAPVAEPQLPLEQPAPVAETPAEPPKRGRGRPPGTKDTKPRVYREGVRPGRPRKVGSSDVPAEPMPRAAAPSDS